MIVVVDPYYVYEQYSVLKLHFTSKNYDAIKYNWKSKSISKKNLLKRKDRSFFWRLSKKFNKQEDYLTFLIGNFVYGLKASKNYWIGDFLDDNAFSQHLKYKKMQEGFTYQFESDIIRLRDTMLEQNLSSPNELITKIEPDTNFPYLINLVLRNDINIETLLFMDHVLKFLSSINRQIGGDGVNFIWDDFYFKIQKYDLLLSSETLTNRAITPFLSNEQVTEIIKNVFSKELKSKKI